MFITPGTGHWVHTNSKTMQQHFTFPANNFPVKTGGDLVLWKVYDSTSHSSVISTYEWPWLNSYPATLTTYAIILFFSCIAWTVKLLSLSRQPCHQLHQLRLWVCDATGQLLFMACEFQRNGKNKANCTALFCSTNACVGPQAQQLQQQSKP